MGICFKFEETKLSYYVILPPDLLAVGSVWILEILKEQWDILECISSCQPAKGLELELLFTTQP